MVKTGEVYFYNEDGKLYLAESFEDENGIVITKTTLVEND